MGSLADLQWTAAVRAPLTGKAIMKLFREYSTIHYQLMTLVAACIVPVWLMAGLLVSHAYVSKLSKVNNDLLQTSRSMVKIVDRELASIEASLMALATSPSFDRDDFVELNRQALEILKAYPGADIVIADVSGQQYLNTFRPFGSPLPKRNNPAALRSIFGSGKPRVSNLFYGAITKRPLIGIDVPVFRNGKVVYDLALNFPSERITSLLLHDMPYGWYCSVLDANDVIVARTSDPKRFVGRQAGSNLRKTMAKAGEGTLATRNIEGVSAYVSFCKSSLSGWAVTVGVPRDAAKAGIYQWMALVIAGVLTVSLIGIVLAVGIAGRIALSIQSLVKPALSIGRGEPVTDLGIQSVTEIHEVAKALVQASALHQGFVATVQQQKESLQQANDLLELRVNERTAELMAAVREQETFSYSVSHDLRAPLRHINSFSTILEEDYGETFPPEVKDYLGRIRQSSQSMGNLIDALLGLARIGKTELKKEWISLSEMAREISRKLQEGEPTRQVQFVIEPDLKIHGDRVLMYQMLENLMHNSWKYSGTRECARIRVGASFEKGVETFYVKDNGVGFDMEYLESIFDPFRRLHGDEFEGHGIGLATVRRIVERHHGSVWAAASEDRGATFFFTLPAEEVSG